MGRPVTGWLDGLADRLSAVPGVVCVALGGSRARGAHRPDSDWDLGVYYRPPLDVTALRRVAAEVVDAGTDATVTAPGEWGPWVDGGAWLTVDGRRVDWIYRDVDRVATVCSDCRRGRYEVGFQVGHPLGFYSHAYAGEVALCRPLRDPDGALARLRAQTRSYPRALADALATRAWEAGFVVDNAAKAVDDPVYVAGCLFRAVGVLAHALAGRDRRWLINEKGMLREAPAAFAVRARELMGTVGRTPAEVAATVAAARVLVAETRADLAR